MDNERMKHYEKKLLAEKKRVYDLLNLMRRNETIDSSFELGSELSLYDNHPADIADELTQREKGAALKANEMSIINKIDEALENIREGKYGICARCSKDIPKERLEFLPYAKYCVHCQEIVSSLNQPMEKNDRPVEEEVLGNPFGYGYNDYTDAVEFDAEDSYQSVEYFNRLDNLEEYFSEDDNNDNVVEPIERISNEQYKAQLPD